MKVNRSLLRQIEPGRWWIAATIALSSLRAVLLVGQAFLISRVIDSVFLRHQGLSDLRIDLLCLLLIAGLSVVLTTLIRVCSVHAATKVKFELRGRLFQRLHALGPTALSSERSGELVNTAQEGIESLDAYISEYLPQLALAALIPLSIIAFILPLDYLSALVLFCTAPLIPVFMVLIGDTADDISRRQWKTLGDLSARFLDVLRGLPTLKLFGQGAAQTERLKKLGETHRVATMHVLRVAFLSALVLELVATISTAIVAVQVGLRLLYGWLAFEQALFVLILAPEFYLPMRSLGAKFHAGISGAVALERVNEILGRRSSHFEPGDKVVSLDLSHPPRIDFDQVRVHFPMREVPGLRGLDLTLQAGSCLALVGPTGAGKSTIARLLLRFIEPDEGLILVDGAPLNQIDPRDWRRHIAWVPQNPFLFNTSVLENLRMAAPGATLERVQWAARQSQAHEFIQRLPHGYETLLGENALQLSAGQAQRIALARAFVKDAALVILDEATANLDRASEAAVMDGIAKLIAGRTSLLITHRLDTLATADQIAVIASGTVLELGTHVQLMRQSGSYARLQTLSRGAS
jgi:thiol reductant ABC exporter CydD subunit